MKRLANRVRLLLCVNVHPSDVLIISDEYSNISLSSRFLTIASLSPTVLCQAIGATLCFESARQLIKQNIIQKRRHVIESSTGADLDGPWQRPPISNSRSKVVLVAATQDAQEVHHEHKHFGARPSSAKEGLHNRSTGSMSRWNRIHVAARKKRKSWLIL